MVGIRSTFSNGIGYYGSGGTPTPTPAYSGSFTLTALNSYENKRIYQRATTSGGGEGKGQGSIALAISSATAGTVGVRIVDQADPSTVLQVCADKTITDGQTTITISDVDARLGWFYVELQGSSGTWQRTSQYMGMGALFGFAGQSLTARLFGRQDGQTATYASLGITPNPNSAVLASYNETNAYMPTVTTAPWITPGDVGNSNGPNSVGIGQFLNNQITLLGVNCGAFGHSQGGTALNTFLSGQANWTRLNDYITRIGGAFEGFVWGQGHTDSTNGQSPVGYASGLTAVFTQLTAANSFASYGKYVWTIPAYSSTANTWGTPFQANWVRKAGVDWAAANSAVYVHMYDFAQVDGIHESQVGAVTMGDWISRATQSYYGGASSLGPLPVSATRSGTTITLTLSNVGQASLSQVGSFGNRIYVFPRGTYNKGGGNAGQNRFPVSSVSITNATTLSITLANDPGDGNELDLWVYWAAGPTDATTDNMYDNTGRIVRANTNVVQIAAPVPAGTVNAPPGGSVAQVSPFTMTPTSATYAAGMAGFGDELTGGTAIAAVGATPAFVPCTVEGFFTCPTVGTLQVLFGGIGPAAAYYIAVSAAGKIVALSGTPVGATTLVAGKRYHVAVQMGPTGRAIYLTNITDAGSGVRDYFNSAAITTAVVPPGVGRFALRNLGGSNAMSGGAVDEWAVFASERYSGASYTAPTVPFTGTEDNIVALYHCNSDVKDVIAW